jgi:hypothetical protein
MGENNKGYQIEGKYEVITTKKTSTSADCTRNDNGQCTKKECCAF